MSISQAIPVITDYAIIIIPMIMWVSAQIIKFTLYSMKNGVDWKYLFEYGHMPSSHTACMTSLVCATGYYADTRSPIFAVALTVALITIYDALKLRTYIGDYGKTINQIVRDSGLKTDGYPELKERVGHTLSEVISGAVLGFGGSTLLIILFKQF